ncbi:hypothetical protein HDU76_007731 [Blyttiomyces sp. JEL0837]|nr:hypothetical protein HDU76_007731 [Blyttiomyces sp. JEL0837]
MSVGIIGGMSAYLSFATIVSPISHVIALTVWALGRTYVTRMWIESPQSLSTTKPPPKSATPPSSKKKQQLGRGSIKPPPPQKPSTPKKNQNTTSNIRSTILTFEKYSVFSGKPVTRTVTVNDLRHYPILSVRRWRVAGDPWWKAGFVLDPLLLRENPILKSLDDEIELITNVENEKLEEEEK